MVDTFADMLFCQPSSVLPNDFTMATLPAQLSCWPLLRLSLRTRLTAIFISRWLALGRNKLSKRSPAHEGLPLNDPESDCENAWF